VVLRILDRSGVTLDFAALGVAPEPLAALLRQLDRPNGIVLVTGPTGSGKTTTLYTALERLNRPDRKLVTVEDPVEYQIRGINQIQVKSEIGLDFAGVLRSTLRHDPDVIMIGEIRDEGTARIAVQAALTGHLVLSTLHTNGAAGTIARLVDLGVSDYLIASTLNAVVAQRLVRVLCPECREPHVLPASLAKELGLEGQPPVYRPKGCPSCLGTGYRGRVALFEVLEIDEAARDRLLARQPAPAAARSLFDDGLDKVLAGVTSLEEVWAVAGER
jgi:general secretion pathway protein E